MYIHIYTYTYAGNYLLVKGGGTEKYTMKGHGAEGYQLFSMLTIKALNKN